MRERPSGIHGVKYRKTEVPALHEDPSDLANASRYVVSVHQHHRRRHQVSGVGGQGQRLQHCQHRWLMLVVGRGCLSEHSTEVDTNDSMAKSHELAAQTTFTATN